MIAGSLQFTLGLQANQFLNALGMSSGKLLGFTTAATAVQAAFHKAWAAVQQGGNLRDLASGLGVSVKSLYQLQRAFEKAGASAESVPAIITRLQRAIGGGEGKDVLTQLGLNSNQMGRLDAAQQIDAVAKSIGRLDKHSQANMASQLFGREGAATFRKIAASGADFSEAMRKAAGDASIWEKVATTFDRIGDMILEISAKVNTIWAQLTGAFIQAFQEGSLTSLITDIVVTGFQAALDILPAMFLKLGEVLLRTLEPLFIGIQAGLEYAIDKGLEAVSNSPVATGIAAMLPGGNAAAVLMQGGWKADSFADIYAQRKAEGVRFNLGFGEIGTSDISGYANQKLSNAFGNAGEHILALQSRLNALLGRLPQSGQEEEKKKGAGISASHQRTSVTNLEKMGLVLSGLGRGFGNDPARDTATHARRMVGLLTDIKRQLAQPTAIQFANL